MSYLNALRLHFAGQFQANVSTVNNDPAHFDNAAFLPSYQAMQDGNGANGWFNPQGDAAFRLLGCRITAAWMPGVQVPASDPVLGYVVADSDGSVPAKLVDLDPEQQLVSEIWGLTVRIARPDGHTLVRGRYEPAAFMDIWDRATGGGGGGDIGAGAAYQSVLRELEWGDVSGSPFLTALQHAADGGALSIKFNVDGLNMDFTSPDFMCGRIVGTIGPWAPGEPRHLVLGRQFMASAAPGGNFFTPAGQINFCPAVVDAATRALYLDLGNALPTTSPGGPIVDLGDLAVGIHDPTATPQAGTGRVVPIGRIPAGGAGGYAGDADWYARTAGVVALPLTAEQSALVSGAPLVVSGASGVEIAESDGGAFLRADQYVYRLSPGDRVDVPVYATRWGRPLSGVHVRFAPDAGQLQPTPATPPYVAAGPPVATPPGVLAFADTVPTDASGIAWLRITAGDPGTPRWFNGGADYGVDGQVYGIRPAFVDPVLNDAPENQWNFVSVLLWSGYVPGDPVTWTDVQPIFQQYANLYPVMMRFLNLADREAVMANAWLLTLAFSLEPSDPNSMPVTRDLSPAKRRAILAWLNDPRPASPRMRSSATVPSTATGEAAAIASGAAQAGPSKGGKAAAAARRLILQTPNGGPR